MAPYNMVSYDIISYDTVQYGYGTEGIRKYWYGFRFLAF